MYLNKSAKPIWESSRRSNNAFWTLFNPNQPPPPEEVLLYFLDKAEMFLSLRLKFPHPKGYNLRNGLHFTSCHWVWRLRLGCRLSCPQAPCTAHPHVRTGAEQRVHQGRKPAEAPLCGHDHTHRHTGSSVLGKAQGQQPEPEEGNWKRRSILKSYHLSDE